MKITIASVFHPYKGGLATYNERLAQEFQQQGHEVQCDTFAMLYPQFLYPGKTQFSSLPAPTDLNISQKINTVNPFNWLINGIRIFRQKPDYLVGLSTLILLKDSR